MNFRRVRPWQKGVSKLAFTFLMLAIALGIAIDGMSGPPGAFLHVLFVFSVCLFLLHFVPMIRVQARRSILGRSRSSRRLHPQSIEPSGRSSQRTRGPHT